MSLSLVATCAVGLEPFLLEELGRLPALEVEAQKGAVAFRGDWPLVWQANLCLRTANRVLLELGSFPAGDGEALARGAQELVESEIRWSGLSARELFDPALTLVVRATTSHSAITDPRWAALKAKDGVVDGQRRRFGQRSTVAREDPDLALRVWLANDRATLLLDTSGEPLDRRGYRLAAGEAPVREQLAAAAVLASGWQGGTPVADPMCGVGTLLAEAGWIGSGFPPGGLRKRFGFHRLPGFDADAYARLRREQLPPGPREVRLFGVDRSESAIEGAWRNLARAGLARSAQLQVADGFHWSPPAGPGLVVVNPSYGSRLAEEPDQWRRLGDLLKQRYAGWTAVVLAGDAGLGKWIGLKPRRRWPVKNGPLEIRILVFDLY